MTSNDNDSPPPAVLRENDWRRLAVPAPDAFTPAETVSVIVPYYRAPALLPAALRALECQTYPRDLMELIVAGDEPDDTLDDLLARGLIPPGVRVLRQPHDGFGAARARNLGAREARGDILVFFDQDIVAAPGAVAEHARWHHAAANLLTIGDREFVAEDAFGPDDVPGVLHALMDGTAGIPTERSHHRRIIDLTRGFTWGGDTVFRAVIGHNVGIRRRSWLALGGQRDDARHWGMEDVEFGYRAYTRGLVIVFVEEARTWHLGPQNQLSDPEKTRGDRLQSALMEQYIADYRFRDAAPGRSFIVPEYVVTIASPDARGDPDVLLETALDVLADAPHDLMTRLDLPEHPTGDRVHDDAVLVVRRRLAGDPRVRFGAPDASLDDFPDSPLHARLLVRRPPGRGVVRRLRRLLGARARVEAQGPRGQALVLERAWAAHRARAGGVAVSEVGPVRTVGWGRAAGRSVALGSRRGPRRISSGRGTRLLRMAARVRRPSDALRLLAHRLSLLRSPGRG